MATLNAFEHVLYIRDEFIPLVLVSKLQQNESEGANLSSWGRLTV
jgi:hypothetical protein